MVYTHYSHYSFIDILMSLSITTKISSLDKLAGKSAFTKVFGNNLTNLWHYLNAHNYHYIYLGYLLLCLLGLFNFGN